MAIITLDENRYINSYMSGNGCACDGGIEIDLPIPEAELIANMGCIQFIDGELILDTVKQAEKQLNAKKDELRYLRESECFSIVNRGQLWYSTLTLDKIGELTRWYKAWLDVTDTLEIPQKPQWITEG